MNTEEILNQFKDLDELKKLYLEYVDKLELKIGVRSLELFIKDVLITEYNNINKNYPVIKAVFIQNGTCVKEYQKIRKAENIHHTLWLLSKNFNEATKHIKQQLNESIRTNI